MKCEAYKCWCGGKKLETAEIVKDNDGKEIYLKLKDGGAYLATEGYTEHWASELDMLNEYPEIVKEADHD